MNWKDKMSGGQADNLTPTQLPATSLAAGIKEEREHSANPQTRTEVAMDHIAKDPNYYDKLKIAERTPLSVLRALRKSMAAATVLLVIISFIGLLASCLSVSSVGNAEDSLPSRTVLSQLRYDRATMKFEIEQKTYEGTAVVDRKSSQAINFTLPKNTIKFMITTCNREEFFPYPDFKVPFKFQYIPIMFLENVESCFMTATAITDKGERVEARIDFRSGEALPGSTSCNGRVNKTVGVGFCQSRAGLIQRISFDETVVMAAQDGCPEMVSVGAWTYEWKSAAGFCAYKFMNKSKEIFRLTSFGYTDISEVLSPKNNQ